jgi:hypothetical protein
MMSKRPPRHPKAIATYVVAGVFLTLVSELSNLCPSLPFEPFSTADEEVGRSVRVLLLVGAIAGLLVRVASSVSVSEPVVSELGLVAGVGREGCDGRGDVDAMKGEVEDLVSVLEGVVSSSSSDGVLLCDDGDVSGALCDDSLSS